MKNKTTRLLYLAGPGDVLGTYRHWRDGRDDPSQVAVTYSVLFFEACRKLNANAKVISYNRLRGRVADKIFDVEHRPVPMQTWRGPFFHIGWYLFSFSVAVSAIRQRSDAVVLMTGTHLWPYWILRLVGCKIILTQHCVIWPKNLGRRGLWKLVHRLDRSFFRSGNDAIISMSYDITEQIEELTGGKHPPVTGFRPFYRADEFADIPEPDQHATPFRVLFAGRAEENKGVLDLIDIAERVHRECAKPVLFDIAGDGGAFDEMKRRVAARGLEKVVLVHGYCEKPKMRQLLKECHAVILPTKAEMIEGFNKVVAEAVIAGRPYITSHLCPAVKYVAESGIEVPPDEIEGYVQAVKTLAEDREQYERYVHASKSEREQFLDPQQNWAAALHRALQSVDLGKDKASSAAGGISRR